MPAWTLLKESQQDASGVYIKQPACDRCGDTRRYKQLVLDPRQAKRHIMNECPNCGLQTWAEV